MAQITDFSQNVDKKTADIPAARDTLNAGARADTTDYLTRFRNAIGGQETTTDMYKRLGEVFGLPQAQASANLLRTTVANLPSTYGAATRGFDVNANQLSRIIGQKTSELTPALTTAENAAQSAASNVGTFMGLEQAQQQKELTPFATEADFLKDRFAREATGFTQDNEMELQAYIAKMQGGITLSEGEATRANQLAIAKLDYDAKIKQIDAQAKYAAFPTGSSTLYNTQTGALKGWTV